MQKAKLQFKIDLHTHSIISPDGGIREFEYKKLLEEKILDCIAITDHNKIDFAQKLQEKLGNSIIVGEEITTKDGELIGLFLKKVIQAGMSASETAKEIHEQGGLVYVPHPFETLRQGVQLEILENMTGEIDIIEVFNGRGKWRGKTNKALEFAEKYGIVGAASSDAHGFKGIGKTYSVIDELPTRESLKKLLREGELEKVYAPIFAFLYPSINRIKNKIT